MSYYSDEMTRIAELLGNDAQARAIAGLPPEVGLATALPPPTPVAQGIAPLETMRASDLMRMDFPPITFTVEGLVPPGLCILGAAPKQRKSWLALSMATSVAGGWLFLQKPTTQGDVLYLMLESGPAQVQARINQMGYGEVAPDALHFTYTAKGLEEGLLEQLTAWCDAEGRRPRLIVIDMLAQVRDVGRRGENAYERDSRVLRKLQRFAIARTLTVLVLHHLRKDSALSRDPLETLSGSMGISGIADATFLLTGVRGEEEQTLSVIGREIETHSMVIRFDMGVWSLVGSDCSDYYDTKAYRESAVARGVLALMRGRERWEGTTSELIGAIHDAGEVEAAVMSASAFSRELGRHEEKLKRDGIAIGRRHSRQGRGTVRSITLTNNARESSLYMP